jgi:type IV pilus assembly protein PilO
VNDFIDQFNSYPLGQKILGLVVLMFGIGVVTYVLALQPTFEETENLRHRAEELQREKKSLEQLKRNRAAVLAELEQLKRRLLIAQEKLPRSAEIPSLLQRIHNQAKTAGLEIRKFERRNDVPKDFYVEIPVAMELTGTYDELANFFYYIGRMTRIVNVKDIGLQRSVKGLTPDGSLKVVAQATTFRFKNANDKKGGKKKKRKKR